MYKAHCSRTQLIADFVHPPTFDTINLPANNDNLQKDKTLQKTNPNTINCDSDDEMYDEQTCESNEIIFHVYGCRRIVAHQTQKKRVNMLILTV